MSEEKALGTSNVPTYTAAFQISLCRRTLTTLQWVPRKPYKSKSWDGHWRVVRIHILWWLSYKCFLTHWFLLKSVKNMSQHSSKKNLFTHFLFWGIVWRGGGEWGVGHSAVEAILPVLKLWAGYTNIGSQLTPLCLSGNQALEMPRTHEVKWTDGHYAQKW